MLTTMTLSVDRAEPNKLDRRVRIKLNILGLSYMTTCYSFPSSASWLMSYCEMPCISMTRQSALLGAFVPLAYTLLKERHEIGSDLLDFEPVITVFDHGNPIVFLSRGTLAESQTDSNACGISHFRSIED
jgi:hypothetical protein